jgi:hypothetical protein
MDDSIIGRFDAAGQVLNSSPIEAESFEQRILLRSVDVFHSRKDPLSFDFTSKESASAVPKRVPNGLPEI